MHETRRLKVWIIILICLLVLFGAYIFYLEFDKDANKVVNSNNGAVKDNEKKEQKISWYTPKGTANKISRISKEELNGEVYENELWVYESEDSNYYLCDTKNCSFEELIIGTNLVIIHDGGKVVYNPATNKAFKYEFEEDNAIPIINDENIVAYLVFKNDPEHEWLREYAIFNVSENKYVSDYKFTTYTTNPVMVKDGKIILERDNWEPCVVDIKTAKILKYFEEYTDLSVASYNEDQYYFVASEYDPQGDFPTIDSIYNSDLEYLNIKGETFIDDYGKIFSLENNTIITYDVLGKKVNEIPIAGEVLYCSYHLFTFVKDVDNVVKIIDKNGNVVAKYDSYPFDYIGTDKDHSIYRLNGFSKNNNQEIIIELYLPTSPELEGNDEGTFFKKYTYNTTTGEKNIEQVVIPGW